MSLSAEEEAGIYPKVDLPSRSADTSKFIAGRDHLTLSLHAFRKLYIKQPFQAAFNLT